MRNQLCPECALALEKLWDDAAEFEWSETGYYTLRDEESEQVRSRLDEASQLQSESWNDAFAIYLELAEAGSPTAAYMVAWCSELGKGTDADLWAAMEWYYKAIDGGSWMGSIEYSRVLNELGYHELADEVLEDGIAANLATAYFRQAKQRYERSRSRSAARAVRPLLERAIELGHPRADHYLRGLQTFGKFGIREVRDGIRWSSNFMARYRESVANHEGTSRQPGSEPPRLEDLR